MVLANYVKTNVIYSCSVNKTIAITFDDGPHNLSKSLVDYLMTQSDVKATFFTVGKLHYPFAIDTQEYQEAMKKAHDVGYQIASHTFEHEISSNVDEFRNSLTLQDDFIEKVTGDRPRYFRAPKGECEEACQANLEEWGYKLIQWDVDTKDWDLETSGSESKRIEDSINVLKEKFAEEKENYLILMHDTENYTISDIAPWIIEKSGMREKGYRFVTVAECLGDKSGMYISGKNYGNDTSSTNTSIHHEDSPISEVIQKNHTNNIFNGNEQSLNSGTSTISIKLISLLPFLLMSLTYLFLF
ncbi:glycoside hydrolase/deacetylase [Piromyces finnis]|uniref:Glycoside hydrolase/deacetylase n=1 Tax=Piromyces finnis TaxID=1754191 RepID=A0A1Y1VDC2_9FUNG|nr:glycoside hydrolase/deacetylase [Piromyces finnis]|eukprot:ORX52881.1 glycoside hydrolase/deacetylase [Piromyces finnis]